MTYASAATQETELWQNLSDEDKQLPVLSFSQLQSMVRCPFQWWMGYKLGYKVPDKERSSALDKGTTLHEGLQVLYNHIKSGGNADEFREEMLRPLTEKWLNSGHREAVVNASHASWLLRRYSFEQKKLDIGHNVLDVERHFLTPVVAPSGRRFLLQGYVDLITIDSNGLVWLWDHKSGQKFWTSMQVLLDPQLPTYAIALREEGITAHGFIINMLNTYDYKKKEEVLNSKLFKRESTHRTDTELVNIARTMLTIADEWLDLLETDDPPNRHMSKDCNMCNFADPCHLNLKGISLEAVLQSAFQKKESAAITQTITLEV